MFSESDSPSVSRRAVITSAAWAVPVVAVAVATPLAAASVAAAPFELVLQSSSVSLPPRGVPFPGFVYLSVKNVTPAALTAVTLSVSGMSASGFVVGTAVGGPWQIVSGDSNSTLVVAWTGLVAEGASTSTLTLTVEYKGSAPFPAAGVLTITPVGVAGVAPAVVSVAG